MVVQKLIFFCNQYAAVSETAELQGNAPRTLTGGGLWVGVLSSGDCLLGDAPGKSGDVLLGVSPLALRPRGDCHLLAVRLTGQCADDFAAALGAARWVDGAACPGAAELLARLCGGSADDREAYGLLCAAARADEPVHQPPPLVAAALAAIRDNYMALYGVEELSEQLGVSKSHLVRVFKEEVGVPPGKYLTQVRIEAAQSLLLEGVYNLETIAGLCGFSGANYLCRVFKRETGLSPAAWRASAAPGMLLPNRAKHTGEMYL